ncbi:unnamed protein product [Withania somnifera]
MEYEILGLVLILLVRIAWYIVIERRQRRLEEYERLPPGPRWWQLVTNIFQSSFASHVSFAKWANKYGPIMTPWLGSMTTVVISSNEVAQEMFKNHDMVLSTTFLDILLGRKVYEAMKGDFGNEGSPITNQYGPHWRMLRRLSTMELFVTSRLDAMRDVRTSFFFMAFNLIGNLMISKDLLDSKFAGKPNIADFSPRWLRWLDPQGIRGKTQFHVKMAFRIAGEFLRERMDDIENGEERKKDYLDVLLQYSGDGVEGPCRFSSRTINVILFEMFAAGTDTTTSTLEWAMAELLHNPTTLQRVQAELRRVINLSNKLEEEDIDKLPYLNAVIKETLRFHPPLPFLVPHMAMDSCTMLGYHIPKETQVIVNVWAIGRDPKTWKDPLKFKPEGFLECNTVDYKGHHFEFIPFGSGRRMCPAVPLVSLVLPLALGSVLRKFDWERMGITLKKAMPLKAIPIAYKG